MNRYLLIIFFLNTFSYLKAQNFSEDFGLIMQSTLNKPLPNTNYYLGSGNNQKMMLGSKNNSKFNPLYNIAQVAMYCYQNIISPQLYRDCPYETTCSNYAKIAIQKKGLIQGTIIGAERLLRCNKMSMLDVTHDDRDVHTSKIIDTEL